jgi:hypothetical protein
MFRSPVVADPPTDDVADPPEQLLPLSHLALDLGGVPPEGWPSFLGRRSIAVVPDFLGRDAIGCDAARRVLDERRADELRKNALRREQERAAVEADELRLAQIYKGVPADAVPVGVHPSTAMLQAAHDAQPRRQSLMEEAFSNSGETTFHPMPDGDDW